MRARLLGAMTVAMLLGAAAPALANSSKSSNWSGYAVHQAHVKFTKVYATWKQPSVTCTAGTPTFSAFWVGLGGYSLNSQALEQIGTEADCTRAGRPKMSAWYELVPSPSRPLTLTVSAGDRLDASVTVTGHKVALSLRNVTTGKSVVKTIQPSELDVSSAEWIAEAPSECVTVNSCQTLPLADFGSAGFSSAGVRATGAPKSGLTNRHWTVTEITLEPSGQRFIGLQGSGTAAGSATPSPLTANGTAFTITYAPAPALPTVAADVASARQLSVSQLFH